MASFEARLDNISQEIWANIVKIDELKGGWVVSSTLSPQTHKGFSLEYWMDKLKLLSRVYSFDPD